MLTLILLIIFFVFPGYLVILQNLLWYAYLWQVKEYRFDRVFSHIKYDEYREPKKIALLITKLGLAAVTALYLASPHSTALLLTVVITYILYISQSHTLLQTVISKRLVRPRIKSVRNLLILSFSVLTLVLPVLLVSVWVFSLPITADMTIPDGGSLPPLAEVLPSEETGVLVIPVQLLVLVLLTLIVLISDLLTHFVVFAWVMVTEPLAQLRRSILINRARSYLNQFKGLKIVAVTGSYGKTTTKELIYQILGKKYKVVRTPKNNNTDVGVAKSLLNDLKVDTEIFVAEMGAYKRGEIKKIVKLVPPDIAVVTGVGEQHLSLFGSIENIFKAKYEIIEGLKDDGVAVLNGDNEYAMKMAEKTDKKKVFYFSLGTKQFISNELAEEPKERKTEFPVDENIYATDIELRVKGLKFSLVHKQNKYIVQTNLMAEHNISNLLAAMSVALQLDIDLKELVTIVNSISFTVPYLNILRGENNSRIIDDGYNASHVGFRSALRFMDRQDTKGKKWVMTQGFIELGEAKKEIYKELAVRIVRTADGLITSDLALANSVKKAKPEFSVISTEGAQGFINAYDDNVAVGDLVLVEGTMSARTMASIVRGK